MPLSAGTAVVGAIVVVGAAVVVETVVEVGVGAVVEGGGTDSGEERKGEGGGGCMSCHDLRHQSTHRNLVMKVPSIRASPQ